LSRHSRRWAWTRTDGDRIKGARIRKVKPEGIIDSVEKSIDRLAKFLDEIKTPADADPDARDGSKNEEQEKQSAQ
jgi:hypothetical protein